MFRFFSTRSSKIFGHNGCRKFKLIFKIIGRFTQYYYFILSKGIQLGSIFYLTTALLASYVVRGWNVKEFDSSNDIYVTACKYRIIIIVQINLIVLNQSMINIMLCCSKFGLLLPLPHFKYGVQQNIVFVCKQGKFKHVHVPKKCLYILNVQIFRGINPVYRNGFLSQQQP